VERRKIIKKNFLARALGVFVINRFNLEQSKIALAFFRWAYMTGNDVAGAQVKAPNLARRNVDIVRAGEIVVIRRSQKTESVRESFQHTFAVNMTILLSLSLQDRKDQLLFAHIGSAFNIEILANERQIADFFLLERFQIQTVVLRRLRLGSARSTTNHTLTLLSSRPAGPSQSLGKFVPTGIYAIEYADEFELAPHFQWQSNKSNAGS